MHKEYIVYHLSGKPFEVQGAKLWIPPVNKQAQATQMDKGKAKKRKPNKPSLSREFEKIELPYDGITDRNTGIGKEMEKLAQWTGNDAATTGGDIYTNQYQAEVVGEEAVGGTTPTPDQNVTENLEKSVGLEIRDRAFLRTYEMLEQRDNRRWELDPQSSEDYQERRD